ncbi:MAG: carboxyl-terminal processing protease [Acidobacteriota bacterium]
MKVLSLTIVGLLLMTDAVGRTAAQAPDGVATFDAAWTIIRDSHFDPAMNGVDWNAVRAELRPGAQAAASTGELRAVIADMLNRLGLSHFALIPATADTPAGDLSADPGFDVRLVDRALLVTHVDREVPQVHAGWRVLQINDTAVADLLRVLPDPSAAVVHGDHSTSAVAGGSAASARLVNVAAWRIAQTRLRGPAGSRVDVVFEDGSGGRVALSLERHPESGQAVTVGSLPTMYVRVETARKVTPGGRSVGLIAFNVWMTAVDAQFQAAVDEFRQADGMVIDLRGNPGGLAAMIMGLSGHFVSAPATLGVMKTRERDLRFPANPRLVNGRGERVAPFAGPLAILVDAMTGSASECFAGGMQSIGRARVFGQPSMGQALPALFDRLPNGDVLIHAYGDFVTSDGTRLEGRGVIPDEIQPIDRQELLAGRDRSLEAALAWIDTARGTAGRQHP